MLTDTRLRTLKPHDKLYKVNDQDGLYVVVTPAGTISFRHNEMVRPGSIAGFEPRDRALSPAEFALTYQAA